MTVVLGGDVDQFPVEPEDRTEAGVAQPRGVLDDGVEDRLDVGRRARDDPQDLGRRRLLLQRLFRLVEQPHVLDGDDRLVGEGLEELDLLVGERPHLGPPDGDRPDGLGPAEQRNGEHCPETVGPRKGTALGVFVNLGLQIGDVDRPPVEHRTSRGRSPRGNAPTGVEGIGPS